MDGAGRDWRLLKSCELPTVNTFSSSAFLSGLLSHARSRAPSRPSSPRPRPVAALLLACAAAPLFTACGGDDPASPTAGASGGAAPSTSACVPDQAQFDAALFGATRAELEARFGCAGVALDASADFAGGHLVEWRDPQHEGRFVQAYFDQGRRLANKEARELLTPGAPATCVPAAVQVRVLAAQQADLVARIPPAHPSTWAACAGHLVGVVEQRGAREEIYRWGSRAAGQPLVELSFMNGELRNIQSQNIK